MKRSEQDDRKEYARNRNQDDPDVGTVLDDMDERILEALKANARASYTEIGERVGLSRVAVKNRIEAMEQKGIIEGYAVKINREPVKEKEGIHFFLEISTFPEYLDLVVDYLGKFDIIRRIYLISGDCRLKVEGYAQSQMRYRMFMTGFKKQWDMIRSVNTQIVIETHKDYDNGVIYTPMSEAEHEEAMARVQRSIMVLEEKLKPSK